VLRARGDTPDARAALGELCAAYYAPVLAFIRRSGRDEDSARDLAQEFFSRLLAKDGLATADPARGRFRSFVLGAVKHFLADMRDRERTVKRGGGQTTVPLESGNDTSSELPVPDPSTPVPDETFDRDWAVAIMSRSLGALAGEFVADGRGTDFEILKPWLVGDAEALSQADAARRLGMTEGALKVAIHRLRKRFRDLVKAEIGSTVDDPAQVQEELRYLVEVLARHGNDR
jgi:RNA polymerase sigma-70 factor (ECF subfamily)